MKGTNHSLSNYQMFLYKKPTISVSKTLHICLTHQTGLFNIPNTYVHKNMHIIDHSVLCIPEWGITHVQYGDRMVRF